MPPAAAIRSSGDLLADRRFAYAQASFDEGDHASAADLALQVLELAPDYAPAHALLGRARLALGDRDSAIPSLSRALELDPDDVVGAAIELARLGAVPPERAIGPGYVRALFDEYAPRFDKHLIKNLNYRGPELIESALRRACPLRGRRFHFRRVLDLGCGTGLMGQALEGRFDAIEGVDLSPKMLAKARKTHLYARLHEGELVSFLKSCGEGAFDLITAADVFVYLGPLDSVFREARRVLAKDGLLAFSVQAHEGDGFALGEDARYSHGGPYLRGLAAEHGFTVACLEHASTRQDRGEDVPGLVVVLGSLSFREAQSAGAESTTGCSGWGPLGAARRPGMTGSGARGLSPWLAIPRCARNPPPRGLPRAAC